ncbi:MAG: hemerythrin domain-containing protein [Candidatus Izemoplasmatales bacterium]|jgi:hemerythrin-like domain-containing protein|nr:hemerythrin domain-containing protein [Candidatus Izemoplasmatales bacterium]NLF49363.1 hemerythrin [Acholeplasmataceae bacterium]
MKYASQDLRDEHDGILVGLDILDSMVSRVKSGHKVEIDDLADMIRFFRTFADQCHHGKEEGLFFPALEQSGVANAKGPIGQMLLEHTQGRSHIAKMAESLKGQTADLDRFVEAAESYSILLRAHIQKENKILFPLADQSLAKDLQKSLLEGFEDHERNVMGENVHEQLHELLHKFQHKYLPDFHR